MDQRSQRMIRAYGSFVELFFVEMTQVVVCSCHQSLWGGEFAIQMMTQEVYIVR
jgi:hypothetical protein